MCKYQSLLINFKYFLILLLGSSLYCSLTLSADESRALTKLKLGLLLSTMKEERYQYDRSIFMEASHKLNIEVIFASSNNDPKLQYSKAKAMLQQGVKALVLQPVDELEAKKIVKLYYDNRVPVIAYDRAIASEYLLAHTSHNNYEIGALQAKEALKAKKDLRRLVICAGEKGHDVAMEITQANISILNKHGVKAFVVYHPKWASEQCKATVLKYLKKGPVDAVLANNSQMAQGAIEALVSLGLDPADLFIAGADGTTQACENILNHKQSFDVHKPIAPLVQETLRLLQNKLLDHKFDWSLPRRQMHTITVPVYPLRKDNLESVYQLSISPTKTTCKKSSW